jgi:hypothetical protein
MIKVMRYLVLALMMVLLPLRGWTGDAMATDMAVKITSQKIHQTASVPQQAGLHDEHHSHEGSRDQATPDAPIYASADTADCLSHAACDQSHDAKHNAVTCESCSACQTCHNVALLVSSDELKPRLNTRWMPYGEADPFASAIAAPDQKPPIS